MRLASMLRGASERGASEEPPTEASASPRHKQRWASALAFAKTQTRDEGGPAVFSHQGPDGAWEPYDAARCLEIQAAIDAQGPDGAVQLDGIPFEVRWGSRATSSRVATPPEEGMIQVNIRNDNTRIVRREQTVEVFSHQGPDGSWEHYDASRCEEIARAIKDQGPDGAVQLAGIPFEVATPPEEGMIQVNMKNDNTRIVRKEASGVLAVKPQPASVDEYEALESVPVKVDLAFKELGDAKTRKLASWIKRSKPIDLEGLYLAGNGIGEPGAISLRMALGTASNLRVLDLAMNQLGDAGAGEIAQLLETLSTEHTLELRLGTNDISSVGVKKICDACVNGALHALFLDNNCVDDDAALHVAALLKTDSKIKHLRLDTNGVGDGGVQAIAEALVANAESVLEHLELDANQFGQGGTRHLSVALQKCPHLTRIDADRRFARDDSGVSQPKSRRKLTRHSSIDAGREKRREIWDRARSAQEHKGLILSGEGFVVQTWRIVVAELYACSAALEAIGMGFGWRPPASITATLFAVFVFDVVLSFNTSVAVWDSTSASRHVAHRWRGGERIKSPVASTASRDRRRWRESRGAEKRGLRASREATRRWRWTDTETRRERGTDRQRHKKHRSFVDQFHEEVFNRKRIAKNYVWRRDRSSNARESPFIAEALALIPDIVRFCGCTASLQRQRNRSGVIKCDRWGSEGYRIIGGLVFLRLVRFQASNREYISGHSARLVYLLVLTVLSMHFMGCLIAYDMYRGRLQGWKGSDLDWSNYMDNNDDVWNVGGTGEYPPLHPLFTNIGDAYFDCIWRVAGVLTGNISWISPAGVPQSSLSRFIGVLCFFYTLLLNAVLISEVGTVMAAVLNSDADADERDEIFAVRRCLHYHRVDAKVSERVLKYYKFAWRSRKGCLPLEDVAAKLPKALRLELDLAALFEKCRAIPFVSAHEGATVIQFLRALSMQTVPAGQVVFRRGEPARALCYVLLGRLAVLDANLQQLQLLIPGMSAGGAGLFSEECTSKVTICNRLRDWAEIASITKADVMTLCENNEVRHWFEEAAHQENFLVKAAAKRSPSEESVGEEAVVAETPTWRQQMRHFEKHKKNKKMDHVRDAIAAFSTFDMHDMVAPEAIRTSSTISPRLRSPQEAPEGLSPQRSVSSATSK